MRQYFVLLLAAMCALLTRAQEARVLGFGANPIDLSAQQYKRTDNHGNLCALIKIQAVTDELNCTGSVIGPVEKHNLSEFWAYVPSDAKMVKIASSSFLPFIYEYPEPLQGGVTYTLKIEVPGATAQTQQAVRQGYLLVRVTPPTATLTVGDKSYSPEDGRVKVLLRNGSYTYRVEAPGFFPADGSVTIDGKTVNQEVTLRSSKPRLSVRATTPGTQIYVNGEQRGTGTLDCEVVEGLNEIEGRIAGHRSFTQTVDLAAGERREVVIPALAPIMGALNINYEPDGAQVTLDGHEVGVTPMIINDVLVGEHTIVVSAPDYESQTLTAKVNEGETTQIEGNLDIKLESFQRNGKYGFKDENGREVIPPKYDEAWLFSEGRALVKLNDKWGYIDMTGQEVIAPKYDGAMGYSEGLAAVELNGKWGFVDKTGRVVIALKYNESGWFSNGLAPVELNGKWGYIDKIGNEVITMNYNGAYPFSEGLAPVQLKGKWGYIDKMGREVIEMKYDEAREYSEGMAPVRVNSKWGYIDKMGRFVITPKYGFVGPFFEGVAPVELNGKWGYIDMTGKKMISFKYDYAFPFENGKAYVKLKGEWFYIDKQGKRVQ